MKNWKVVLLLGACLMFSGFASNSAFAQSPNASVYVVHGIPGHDVSTALDPALPVDVQVNGAICLISGLKFGDIVGPYTIPPGYYDFKISLANTIKPCSNAALLTANHVGVEAGWNVSVVAFLNAEGAPGVTTFLNDLKPTPAGKSRIIVQHTANAPAVDITVSQDQVPTSSTVTTTQLAKVSDVTNGEQAAALLPSGPLWNYPLTQVTLTPHGESSPVIGPYYFQLVPHRAYLIYAVGSVSTGSFTLISKTIPGL
jgi:hypothetical protein